MIILAVVYIGLVRYNSAKTQKLKDQASDVKRANEILTKSATRPIERVRKLDDAGYRD